MTIPHRHLRENATLHGFTLIELSIVLVIIGLIVGGVLVGQDLIKAAETRATLTQIEKYNAAVNTFRVKFNAIPGDMSTANAATYGFSVRPGIAGQGDGNGLIDGEAGVASLLQGSGETGNFWVDLSSSAANNLIDGSFSTTNIVWTTPPTIASTAVSNFLPPARLSGGKFIYVYNTSGANWYGLSSVASAAAGVITTSPTVTVIQSYNMDKKVDDGMALTGNVQAYFVSASTVTAATSTVTSGGTAISCFDTATASGAYSITKSGGTGTNCALSFRFQ